MFIELDPGSDAAPVAEEGWTIPVAEHAARRQPRRGPRRARRRHARLPASCSSTARARACEGRGNDLQEVFRRFEPTHRDLAARHRARSPSAAEPAPADPLARRAQRRAGRARTTSSPSSSTRRPTVFRAFASEEENVSRAVARAARRAARRRPTTLGKVETLRRRPRARRPTDLRPAVAQLDDANQALDAVRARRPRRSLRDADPPVRRATPGRSCATCAPAADDLAKATPDLTRVVHGAQPPVQHARLQPRTAARARATPTRDEGYLFWLAWLQPQRRRAVLELATRTARSARSRSARTCAIAQADRRRARPAQLGDAPRAGALRPRVCDAGRCG